MRSTPPAPPSRSGPRQASDLTARARLRDAAIEVFGAEGFDASVRTIAARAGVSPGLVIHHFGSKDNLRAVCDEHVATLIAEAKRDSVGPRAASTLLSQLAVMDEYAWLLGYIMQSFTRGGPLAAKLFEVIAADAEEYIAEGVEQGTVRESIDPKARARFLANTGIGSMMLMMALEQPGPGADWGDLMQRWGQEFIVPALELYTHGLFTDDSVLQAYLDHLGPGTAGPAPTDHRTEPPPTDHSAGPPATDHSTEPAPNHTSGPPTTTDQAPGADRAPGQPDKESR